MADRSPMTVTAINGRVVIDVDPETALDLMVAFQAAHEASPDLQTARPNWYHDVLSLVIASAEARLQGRGVPGPVLVPVVPASSPRLRLIAGGAS